MAYYRGGTRTNNEMLTTFFTRLWELKIPSKILILIWRIAYNYLPTLHNLRVRSLVVNILCPVCQMEEESMDHLFRVCTFTQQVLRDVGVSVSTCNRESVWKNWLAAEFVNQSIEACTIRSIAYWAIWYSRNKLYYEGTRMQAYEVVGFVKAYYTETAILGERLQSKSDIRRPVWEPPNNDTIKIKFDASFNQITKCSILGIIARNKEGLIMAACTYPWEYISDPVTAEARACLQTIVMAEELGFQDICIEGDTLTEIRKLNAAEDDRSCISNLIKEIKERSYKFRRVRFKHVSRGANKVAHAMAKEGGHYEHPRFWIEEALQSVEILVNQKRRNSDSSGEVER
ncbi:hypothetical protein CXB51_011859 [Gossypium anomalum]|uniref:Reverse transcriptase n=1 Tax=Gossypium anomalum TaxID=47600 RepID=A0A8J6D0J2_9ROSI|nr:hypothetical protein CXB51_011859 [Gossypium anomalum]